MSIVIPVPSLSTLGWVTDPVNKMDLLLSHFYLSDYNQTYLYKGNVSSLPRIIEEFGTEINEVIRALQQTTQSYLSSYYDSVNVEVSSASDLLTDPRIAVDLTLTIGVRDNGTQTVFGRLLQSTNSKIDRIITLNNG
jgi:hypothetical protein